ncbi:MAG: GNAT family N-acetyltransferase [Clostridiales bacterium]|jgi:hypothetical protein|nr:GNAT family N-acetyltransferase [Clostridiales bacterium]
MEQLIMNWVRSKSAALMEIELPKEFTIRKFNRSEADVEAWLDIVQYGLTDGRGDRTLFQDLMEHHPGYDPNGVYFIEKNGIPCATISIFCNPVTLHGYIHMVCASPSVRGCGIGTALAGLAVNELISHGMETAHLTTDDFRKPAIKTYLKAGFVPQRSGSDDFPARWDAILSQIKM